MFGMWMRLLQEVPDSVLWLLAGNRYVANHLQRAAGEQGIDPARLCFAPRVNMTEHLARHHFVDLFLDTFPVNAHTTASDALWMGCPLLTLAGATFVSRVAGSLLRAVGLSELITTTCEQYEIAALQLAQNRPRLREIREHLNHVRETSSLFQGASFARHVESAYESIWLRYAAGEPPQAFRVAE
jgi:predicted O-linked N-acetylglucosamine transferase (SPINDLY family)